MAEYYAFDMYFLLVEHVFGNIWYTGIGMIIGFLLLGMLARMSTTTLIWFIGFFIGVFIIGAVGELAYVIMFSFAAFYFGYNLLKFIAFVRA